MLPRLFARQVLSHINKTAQSLLGSRLPSSSSSHAQGKVYDVFTFFNELELLEIRLNILDEHVDHFVLVEATETFSGKPKPLFYDANKANFAKWHHKLIHYVIDDVPADPSELRQRLESPSLTALDREIITNSLTSDNVPDGQLHWLKEFYQKECIKKALVGLDENDVCFVSDLDEIWDPRNRFECYAHRVYKLRQLVYSYFLNNRSSERWAGTLAARYATIRQHCLNHLRTPAKCRYRYVANGGWHFTNMGGADRIRTKLESYGHQEFNNDAIKHDLENKIARNIDFVGRRFNFWTDETQLPDYVLHNRDKYKHLFK